MMMSPRAITLVCRGISGATYIIC